MMRKKATTRSTDSRVPVKVVAPRYGFGLRLADNFHGRQDARRTDENSPIAEMPWTQRLIATAEETDHLLLVTAQDRARPAVVRLRTIRRSLGELDRRITDVQTRKNELPKPDLTARGGAEAHLDTAAITTRRTREHRNLQAPLQAEIDRLRAQRDSAVTEGITLEAQLIEAFDTTVQMSRRDTEFFNRRLATYTRQIHRRRRTAITVPRVQAPTWTQKPCPWLPTTQTPPGLAT